jgi:hypothetical protein
MPDLLTLLSFLRKREPSGAIYSDKGGDLGPRLRGDDYIILHATLFSSAATTR